MKSKAAYPWFYFLRIARLSLLVFLPTLLLVLILYRGSYKQGLVSQMTLQAREDLENHRFTLEQTGVEARSWCRFLTPNFSLLDQSGTNLCNTNIEVHAKSLQASLELKDGLVLRKIVPWSSLQENLKQFDRQLFLQIVPIAFLSYLIFLWLFYEATKPLGIILSKVEKFQVDVPFKKTIQLLYMKDKWAQIEEALNEADHKLQDQVNKTRLENEKISTILESIYDDIIAIDPFETVLFTNSNFDKNFVRGRTLGEILPKLWHLFSDEEILGTFRQVLKSGERAAVRGMALLPNRFFDLTVTALRDPSSKIVGALGVFYDVTDFKLTEQMRVDFVANVSHEIRTPLTSVKGYTQVLQGQKEKFPQELAPFLDKILMNTERMISLFNDLLNLSVIESKFQLKKEDLDLPDFVDEISANITTNYPDRSVRFETDLELKTIQADSRLMEQVLSNLFDNACKYSEKDQDILIRVKSRKSNGQAIISVCDNGPGISPEHLQRIFERFYRIEASREVSRGTGLGLSIVKHIISRHGGRIWAESQGERGSTFVIELPLE